MTPIKITPKLLQELIRYEPETGKMFWKERAEHYFNTPTTAFLWNAANVGREVFKRYNPSQYIQREIFGKALLAHRAAWAIHYGEWPAAALDHINGQVTDNRICNLREANATLNQRNKVLGSNNTSGHVGVYKTKSGTFAAKILKNHIGTFAEFEEAAKARQETQTATPGFTERHGKRRIVNYGYRHLKLARLEKRAAAK